MSSYHNRLVNETSLYLKQHCKNPVDWYPWGQEALQKAKTENKLLIISIGYASCHWCHVMEQESFENIGIATFMNKYFVCIKVDREERPDIDFFYMDALRSQTGQAGWPLNMIALPNTHPLYGGTYFSPTKWMSLLEQVVELMKKDSEKAIDYSDDLLRAIRQIEHDKEATSSKEIQIDELNFICKRWESLFDYENGGCKDPPKFPFPIAYEFLLFYTQSNKNPKLVEIIELTLNKMRLGGICDHLGGGFARYATDVNWRVPHFEKMLYDNAQLVSLYSHAYQCFNSEQYLETIQSTLSFIERELGAPEGGYYSSIDAVTNYNEGEFYVWTQKELQEILTEHHNLIIDYYSITEEGNWEEGKNILYCNVSDDDFAKSKGIPLAEWKGILNDSKQILHKKQNERVRPKTDEKIILSWNSLMLKGYVDAYRATQNESYSQKAINIGKFIETYLLRNSNLLFRIYEKGRISIDSFLDDYAFTIEGFINLYQITFNEKWLQLARKLTQYTLKEFYDAESGLFYFTQKNDNSLPIKKIDIEDNVIPSSNSQMAKNLFILGKYFINDGYIKISKSMIDKVKHQAIEKGLYFSNWNILWSWMISAPYEVVIVGEKAHQFRKELQTHYLPNIFISGSIRESNLPLLKHKFKKGRTQIFICQNKECSVPYNSVSKAIEYIQ